jgi:uncharacterized FAD-dependent dehydrogenase
MIRIQQVKVPLKHTQADVVRKACKMLHLKEEEIIAYQISKQSIDARKKTELSYVYTIDLKLKQEEKLLKKKFLANVVQPKEVNYIFPNAGQEQLAERPIIIGSGPAGIFCAYALAEHGYRPIVIERGCDVDKRTQDVEVFWQGGSLKKNSNVQFGEGGAGTFSDGKLNTLVKDPVGRNQRVLELFVQAGAPEEILYINKPHIGTDILKTVVKNLREEIIHMGGSFIFETQLTSITIQDNRICEIELNDNEKLAVSVLVLAIGHSARDTFEMLSKTPLVIEAKSFAIGMRVEHPQDMMNRQQYHDADMKYLTPASYKVTAKLENGRGVYSFCMCPGGYVVNASSEEGHLAVNGMSYYNRDGSNANSAIIVSVTPKDFPNDGPLGGIAFQRDLEEKAYQAANGKIPQQLFGDFEKNVVSTEYGTYESTTKGASAFADLRQLFSPEITDSFIQGMHSFAKYIPEFDRSDAILSGVESRTSSPVRITRNEAFMSNVEGIYPCGEGAGYAGGIMSAAMDGLKVAEAIATRYRK